MALVCRFVDAISGTATVRLDLAVSPWTIRRRTALPPPPMNAVTAESMLTDGGQVTASTYGNRTLQIELRLKTATQADFAEQLQALHRELDRATNVLEWAADGAASSVFFRTFRSPDYDIDDQLAKLAEDPEAVLTLRLRAEPFGYGTKQTLPDVVCSTASPVHTISGSGVLGDVPAPLLLEFEVPANRYHRYYVASRVGELAMQPLVDHDDAAAAISYSAAGWEASDSASASAVGGDWRLTAAMADGAEVSVEITAHLRSGESAVDLPGTYRVLALMGNTDVGGYTAADHFRVQLRTSYSSYFGVAGYLDLGETQYFGDPDDILNFTASPSLVDLGLVQFPFGGLAAAGFDAPGVMDEPRLSVFITKEHTGGTTQVQFDGLYLLPADDTFLRLSAQTPAGSARTFQLDPVSGQILSFTSTGLAPDQAHVTSEGAPPNVVPGQDVQIVALRGYGNARHAAYRADAGTDNDLAVTIGVAYWPRYLMVAG